MIPQNWKYLPSYANRAGRKMRSARSEAIAELLPELEIDLDDSGSLSAFLNDYEDMVLEIGFGDGEHLLHRASSDENTAYIGCELYMQGIANCLKNWQKYYDQGRDNLRIFTQDARLLLEKIPANSIAKTYILFPDPWPKNRHNKRRIVNQETLSLLSNVTKPGGELIIASDHHEYAQWVMIHAANHPEWQCDIIDADEFKNPPTGHILTKYQQKNKARSAYPLFMKFLHVPV